METDNRKDDIINYENMIFDGFIREFPKELQQDFKSKVKYIRLFTRQYPKFDKDKMPIIDYHKYYKLRNQYLEKTMLDIDEFRGFNLLQKSIESMGLEPNPTFELINYLYYRLCNHDNKAHTTYQEKFQHLSDSINQHPDTKIHICFKIGRDSLKITDVDTSKRILETLSTSNKFNYLYEEFKQQKRRIDYELVSTLLNTLPTKPKKNNQKYTQAERNFGLCVLYLCKRLQGEVTEVCSRENNVTFDKLMRDFKDAPPIYISDILT